MMIFFIAVITSISLFTLYQTFNLALFGDDWLAFFRYLQHLGPQSTSQWNHITYFLTPYGAQDILMGLLQKIYGYQSTPYFIISYLLRIIAAFSLFPLVFYLTKSKLATFFAILFFSVTTTGLDTTNWVFNMPSYITVALFNLCLYFFISSREKKNLILLTISGLLYYLAYVVTPIRMHGSLPLIVLLEIFLYLQTKNLKSLKSSLLRVGLFVFIFLVIRYTGQSQGPPQEASERLLLGITSMTKLLQNGDWGFLFNPLIIFSSMFIPDFILPVIGRNFILTLIGITITIFVILKIKRHFKTTHLSTTLFLGISWSILSFFLAWWWIPTTIFPTVYRYLIPSAVGISILIAGFIALGKNKTQQKLLFTIFLFVIFLHIITTRTYINYLVNTRGQDISNKIWSSMPRIEGIGESKEPLIFYFEGDGTNEAIIHDIITFGLPPHMALIYNLREEDGGIPIPMTNWQEVISAATKGQTLPNYGYPIKPVSPERIYAFHLSGYDNLINITDSLREKLLQIISQDISNP
jgi:hypothetical protein